ncbi:MAG: L-serine ammonia-lyase, iron-sulfur-dependent, subunit alpha [Clostridiales bacterium]|nr:L-serine ammonia-lyase, iron-sulfur-dependent, subunit alpha [Clostridiales bacterium]
MREANHDSSDALIQLIQEQIAAAVGCTEPAAVAYASALAARALGREPETIDVGVSRNVLKNAMGVGIPGTDMVGLPTAAVLGAFVGDPEAELAVLHRVTKKDAEMAREFVEHGNIRIHLCAEVPKLYIEVKAVRDEEVGCAVIEGTHTHVVKIEKNGQLLHSGKEDRKAEVQEEDRSLSLEEIDAFVRTVDAAKLAFLQETVDMNLRIGEDGLAGNYGMSVGKTIWNCMNAGKLPRTEENEAIALSCGAADARMAGSTDPVMTSCGSGNQGLTATLPVISVCMSRGLDEGTMYRALAYSLLVTIYVKRRIGKLSALCACSVGASIGTACALTWLDGGTSRQIRYSIDNVIADVAGVICDGAKPGCALKIASGVKSAFMASMLAMANMHATVYDGIVGTTQEKSIENLGILSTDGMSETDAVILGMLCSKT